MPRKDESLRIAEIRARRREMGMRSMEAVFFERELQQLDAVKIRLKLTSRSEVLRLLMAKTDLNTLTSADAAVLKRDAA